MRRITSRSAVFAVAVACMLALSACTPTPGVDPAPATSSAAPSLAPTETATATPTTPPPAAGNYEDLSDWIITSTSVGPIRIGDDFAAVQAAATKAGWARGCGDGREQDPFLFSPNLDVIVMAYETGTVQEIVVKVPGMATDTGFKIRDAIDTVQGLYPDATETQVKYAPMAFRVAQDGVVTYFADYAQSGNADTIILTTQPHPSSEYCS